MGNLLASLASALGAPVKVIRLLMMCDEMNTTTITFDVSISHTRGDKMTVLEALERRYPHTVANWDKWDYRISSPVSLDDHAIVQVTLINKLGQERHFTLPLGYNATARRTK